jgi:transcriptional regulator with XRE-family HTH domain
LARTARSDADRKSDAALGKRIASLRKQRGLTQVELAKKLGVAQPILSNYEHGKLRPNHQVLAALAKALAVSTDELLGIQGSSANPPLNRRFLKRLVAIQALPKRDQEALIRTIDAFLSKAS